MEVYKCQVKERVKGQEWNREEQDIIKLRKKAPL